MTIAPLVLMNPHRLPTRTGARPSLKLERLVKGWWDDDFVGGADETVLRRPHSRNGISISCRIPITDQG